MTFKEFTETEDYRWSDVVYIVDKDGIAPDSEDDWLTDDTEVIDWKKTSEPASLEIVVKRGERNGN